MNTETFDTVDLGNIFKNSPNSVIRWIVALAMASNDLNLNSKLVQQYGDATETNYFGRLAFSHLREIAKRVGEGQKNQDIQIFLAKLDNSTKEIYVKIVNDLAPFEEDSLVKSVLAPIRLSCFHYPDLLGKEEPFKDLSEMVKSRNNQVVRFSNQDKTLLGHRYLFADAIAGSLMNDRLSTEIVRNLSQISMNIMQFVDHALAYMKNQVMLDKVWGGQGN